MAECKVKKNLKRCTCSYGSCEREGTCCDCLHYHWRMGQLPGCLFPPDVERTYDRSVERFVKTFQERGAWW